MLQGMVDRQRAALAEPFVGVTADGGAEAGLFHLAPSGVSTEPLRRAARDLLEALGPDQRDAITFPLETDAWRSWGNISPFLLRHGLLLETLSADSRALALELVRESLSQAGFETARDVMRLNETIARITGRAHEYGEWLYWLSVMGTPSADEPWGWQIDGHHLIVNCLMVGDQVVMTPQFMGSEPVEADGMRVFGVEEEGGYRLMSSLGAERQAVARIGMELPIDVLGTAASDNLVLPYAGVRFGELSTAEQRLLLDLIGVYVERLRPGHAEVKLAEVRQHLERTYFAWIGECSPTAPFYYRVHSPVLLIEFDHQRGIALDNDSPSRQHIHTVVRTPNGNDYGKDLLRQHYAEAHRSA
jgi:Protein of unknown function (DUF3500)